MSVIIAKTNSRLESLEKMSPTLAIVLICGLSCVVKLGYIFILGGGLGAFPQEGTDGSFYYTAAMSILKYGQYAVEVGQPTIGMPPGESLYLAALFSVSNNSFAFAKLANTVLLSIVAGLTYSTGRQVANKSVGFLAGMMIAIDPAQAYLAGTFLSEPLFIFLVCVAIHVLTRQELGMHWVSTICAGFCLGLAGLTRNQGWLFSVALLLGALITRERLMPIRVATMLLLTTCLTIAPWTIRNYKLTGQFVPVSSEGGLTLWASNNPEFVFRPPMPMSSPLYNAPSDLASVGVDQYYRELASSWIMSHPLDFVANGLRKMFALYYFDPLSWRPETSQLFRLVGLVPYGILLPFILLGLLNNLRKPQFAIILWYILFTTLLAFLFYGDSRIRAPIQPFLYLFGVMGVLTAVMRLSPKRSKSIGSVGHTMESSEATDR